MSTSLKSRRAKRKTRNNQQQGKLNLISLMDIFTILVFFLMVNSGDVKVLQGDKSIKLPDSTAEKIPEDNLVLFIGKDHLLVQNKEITSIKAINNHADEIIPQLKKELTYLAAKKAPLSEEEAEIGYGITVMGDGKVPYKLLKKVLATCADSEFRDVSLAVNRVADKSSNLSIDNAISQR